MSSHRIGIIVPYRNRHEHLKKFKSRIIQYCKRYSIDYRLIIIQQDDAKLFNRGMLLNIGFTYAKKYHCDYVVFHDVDMLPIEVDYSYTENVTHLATNFQNEDDEIDRESFDTYFGGVTMFPTEAFSTINGYSNKYWGWGFEDDDLFLRCRLYGINLQTKKIRNIGKNTQLLKFNGNNAYVKVKNTIDLNSNFSISITFEPSELKLNHTKQSDEFSIFSIPGYDFAISYTSFNRYNFCVFDTTNKAIYLNSEIKPT
jgi:predicted glycosyltransferase involved in capsule biosynthesis